MDKGMESLKLGISGIYAFMPAFGSHRRLVVLLMAFMAADTLFGHLRAWKNREWKSSNARWGVVGKLVELTTVMLMYLCEWTFGVDFLVNASAIYFLMCESASILENIIQGGLNESFPDELPQMLGRLKKNAVRALLKKLEEFLKE